MGPQQAKPRVSGFLIIPFACLLPLLRELRAISHLLEQIGIRTDHEADDLVSTLSVEPVLMIKRAKVFCLTLVFRQQQKPPSSVG